MWSTAWHKTQAYLMKLRSLFLPTSPLYTPEEPGGQGMPGEKAPASRPTRESWPSLLAPGDITK